MFGPSHWVLVRVHAKKYRLSLERMCEWLYTNVWTKSFIPLYVHANKYRLSLERMCDWLYKPMFGPSHWVLVRVHAKKYRLSLERMCEWLYTNVWTKSFIPLYVHANKYRLSLERMSDRLAITDVWTKLLSSTPCPRQTNIDFPLKECARGYNTDVWTKLLSSTPCPRQKQISTFPWKNVRVAMYRCLDQVT